MTSPAPLVLERVEHAGPAREAAWQRRLAFEAELSSSRRLRRFLDPGVSPVAHRILASALFVLGLRGRGRKETRAIHLREREVRLARLPAALDGLRLLHLSDLHLGDGSDFPDHVARAVGGIDADVAVITGDFRFHKRGPVAPAMEAFAPVRRAIQAPAVGILGNHDPAETRTHLEALDVHVLVNEALRLRRGDGVLHLLGVDDPHVFRTDDLAAAHEGVPVDGCRILLAHSPEGYVEAAAADIDLLLCGHTHGGQIALPGGVPIFKNARCPRRVVRGAWREGALQGYTSIGTGYSTIDVRVNCPPEIVVHTLRRP